jgi:putative DNA primase/helicase
VLGRFLETCTVREPGHRVQSSVLHQVYEAWCKSPARRRGRTAASPLAMDERGYERKQSDVVWWLDLKLIKSVNDSSTNDGNASDDEATSRNGKNRFGFKMLDLLTMGGCG